MSRISYRAEDALESHGKHKHDSDEGRQQLDGGKNQVTGNTGKDKRQ